MDRGWFEDPDADEPCLIAGQRLPTPDEYDPRYFDLDDELKGPTDGDNRQREMDGEGGVRRTALPGAEHSDGEVDEVDSEKP